MPGVFPIKVDPLNLDIVNQAKNIPMVLSSSQNLRQIGPEGFISYDPTYKPTNRNYYFYVLKVVHSVCLSV